MVLIKQYIKFDESVCAYLETMSLVLLLSSFILFSEEREKPELLAESPDRRRRIAKDSGKTEQQVSQLVAQLFQMRVRMKNLMGIMEGGSIPTLSNLENAMKAEQAAPPGTARRKRRSESRRQFADSASTRPSPRGFGAKN